MLTGMSPDAVRVRKYFAQLPRGTRVKLRQMRSVIKSAAPRAVEAFSYRIPAFRLDGRILVWYAGFTGHCSLFPMGTAIRRAFARELGQYETSKGTVRFPLDRPLPVGLVRRLVKARIRELAPGPKRS